MMISATRWVPASPPSAPISPTLSGIVPLLLSVALALASASAPAPAWAGPVFYRWVDELGTTQFTASPPTGGVPYEEVSTITPDPAEGAERRAALEERLQQSDQQRKKAERSAAEEAEQADIAAEKDRLCSQARKRLASVSRARVNRTKADGAVVRLGEEERQAAIAEAKKYLQDKDC